MYKQTNLQWQHGLEAWQDKSMSLCLFGSMHNQTFTAPDSHRAERVDQVHWTTLPNWDVYYWQAFLLKKGRPNGIFDIKCYNCTTEQLSQMLLLLQLGTSPAHFKSLAQYLLARWRRTLLLGLVVVWQQWWCHGDISCLADLRVTYIGPGNHSKAPPPAPSVILSSFFCWHCLVLPEIRQSG